MTTSTLPEPLARFSLWWDERKKLDPTETSSAMVVSSVDARGRPSSRVVLLRGFDARGFTFFTNLESRKGRELLGTKSAALNFHWPPIGAAPGRQVRVEGTAERVDDAEADAYFASRARDSQLGAWASDQSRPLADLDALLARVDAMRRRFEGGPVPRPPHWSGIRVVPDAVELWQEGAFRLHTRERYERAGGVWTRALLYP
jgi:pyridoxamine 5'-phosphate oxidase